MYYVSKSATTSSLISFAVRDLPFTQLYQYYGFILRNELADEDVFIMTQDYSTSVEDYQHFILTGSTISLPMNEYRYRLYAASGATSDDIIYTKVLERGLLKIIG